MSSTWRRLSGLYLVTFLYVAMAVPHLPLDPVADRISERPSESGTFARISVPAGQSQDLCPGTLVEDESCLACLNQDFVDAPAVAILLALESLPRRPVEPLMASPALVLADAPSRAPPASA